MTAIAKYLEAVAGAAVFRHGDSLERFLIAEADMHGVARAAMDAADEVRELVELCREHFSTEQTIEYPERRWEREKRIRELVREE